MSHGSNRLETPDDDENPLDEKLEEKHVNRKDANIQSVVQIIPTAEDYQANISQNELLSFNGNTSQIIRLPSNQMKLFHNYLEYCPLEAIENDSEKIIELPQIRHQLKDKAQERLISNLRTLSLSDDDGVAELCSDLIQRAKSGQTTSYMANETQTNLMVRPYLLEEPKVATVFLSVGIQTINVQCKSDISDSRPCCCESSSNRGPLVDNP